LWHPKPPFVLSQKLQDKLYFIPNKNKYDVTKIVVR
jgi:hypothetical protein